MRPVRVPERPRFPLMLGIVVLLAVMALALPTFSLAQPILDAPFPEAKTTSQFANAVFRFGIIIVILAAAIYIAIGAYMYFIAAGNAEMAKTGKDYITRSLTGLVLGLLAWVILNTISPQFAEQLRDPQPGAVRGTTADPASPGDAAARR